MPEIVGYADKLYIKGQYYGLAASPKPVEFSGNIDDLSDEEALLSKAMLISRGSVTGNLPNVSGNTFLITTVKYGDSTYLQTAYMLQSGFDCWEYRRIYSGGWTDWVAVDEAISNMKVSVDSAVGLANSVSNDISGPGGINSQITGLSQDIKSLGNTINGVSRDVSGLSGSVKTLNDKMLLSDIANDYTITKTSGDSKWSFGAIEAKKSGNVVSVAIRFDFNRGTWATGSTPFEGNITSKSGLLPITTTRLIAYYTTSLIICTLTPAGKVQVRVISGTLAPGGSKDSITPTGMFMVNG